MIAVFIKKRKATLRELQSLIGVLNFACSVVVPGRCFLRRLIDLTIGLRRPNHFVRVTKEVKADLFTWQQFFQEYNGKSFFLNENWENSMSLQLHTDAAGAHGFGAIFGNHWCFGEWPREWLGKNIAILEFYPIVLSLMLWGNQIKNRCITFFTDNEALVHVINKSTCKDTTLMVFVRKLVLVCLNHNILFKAKHISLSWTSFLVRTLFLHSRLQLLCAVLEKEGSVGQVPVAAGFPCSASYIQINRFLQDNGCLVLLCFCNNIIFTRWGC